MFSDKSFDVVSYPSCWKTEREMQEEGVQTSDISYNEQESQASTSRNIETQTENSQTEMVFAENVDYDKLASFLRRISPKVISELDKMQRSRAFDGYETIDDDIDGAVKKLHTFHISQNQKKVSCMSWSCTGAVIAFGYSFSEHENWCDHSGSVHLFNINRQEISPSTPSKTLETSSCLTSLSAHPFEPSILAAGTYSGEIFIWNLQKDDDCLICSSSTIPGAHREAVTQVSWVRNPDPTQQRPLLASSGRDGRILVWQVGTHSGSLNINEGFVIMLENIKYSGPGRTLPSPVGATGGDIEIGVTCFSFATYDLTTFIVAVDGGGLLSCSTLAAKPAPVQSEVPLKDPVISSFEKHQGAVTALQFSPHHENTFLTSGTDNEIRIYHLNQVSPVQMIYVESGVVGLEWSLAYPNVFAAWGSSSGNVNFYNLYSGEIIPSLQLPASEKKSSVVTAVCCNPRSTRLVAVGDMNGKVVIWQQSTFKEAK